MGIKATSPSPLRVPMVQGTLKDTQRRIPLDPLKFKGTRRGPCDVGDGSGSEPEVSCAKGPTTVFGGLSIGFPSLIFETSGHMYNRIVWTSRRISHTQGKQPAPETSSLGAPQYWKRVGRQYNYMGTKRAWHLSFWVDKPKEV